MHESTDPGRKLRAWSTNRGRALVAGLAVAVSGLAFAISGGAAAAKSASKASTINIMQVYDVTSPTYPEPAGAAAGKAIVESLNAHGGIAGHHVALTICNSQGDPNVTAACGREAVKMHVAAVVGSFEYNPASIMPILTAAKIPYLPSYPFDPSEFSSPVSFPISSGLLGVPAPAALAAKYCKSTVTLLPAVAAVPFYTAVVNAALKAAGKPPTTVVQIPLTPGDYAAQAAQIVGTNAQCEIDELSVGQELSLFPALQSAGSTQRLVGATNGLTPLVISKLPGSLTNGALVADFTLPYSASQWAPFRAILAKYSDPRKYVFGTAGPELVYLSFMMFQQVVEADLKHHSSVTSANLLATLKKTTSVNTDGLLPPINFTKASPIKGYPRMFGRSVTYSIIVNHGTIVSLDHNKFHDMTSILQSVIGSAS